MCVKQNPRVLLQYSTAVLFLIYNKKKKPPPSLSVLHTTFLTNEAHQAFQSTWVLVTQNLPTSNSAVKMHHLFKKSVFLYAVDCCSLKVQYFKYTESFLFFKQQCYHIMEQTDVNLSGQSLWKSMSFSAGRVVN